MSLVPWFCMTDRYHTQRRKITHVFCTLVLYNGHVSHMHNGERSHMSLVPWYCITDRYHTRTTEKDHTYLLYLGIV